MPGPNSTEDLIGVLDAIAGRRYAVVDAAHFDNLQDLLTEAGLPFHPLYLDERDPAPGAEIAGPHLVELPTRSSARKLLTLADGKPAIVWWVWPERGEGTTAEIYRHLRRLNVVEIPLQPAQTPGAENGQGDHDHLGHDHGPPPPEPDRYDLVIFRHGDPAVIAMLLPLLDATQVSRLFGDAACIVVDVPDSGGVRSFQRPTNLPTKSRGRLRIRPEQYDRLRQTRIAASRARIAQYIRKHLPPPLEHMTDDQIADLVVKSEATGKALGLRSERGQARWAYLMMMTGGQAANTHEATDFIRQGANPDRQVKELIDLTAKALRASAGGAGAY